MHTRVITLSGRVPIAAISIYEKLLRAVRTKVEGHKSLLIPRKRVESPPLWVWAIIVGAIIASKFLWRWSVLKRLARELRKNTHN